MTHKEYQKLFLSAPLRYLYERGDISQRQYAALDPAGAVYVPKYPHYGRFA